MNVSRCRAYAKCTVWLFRLVPFTQSKQNNAFSVLFSSCCYNLELFHFFCLATHDLMWLYRLSVCVLQMSLRPSPCLGEQLISIQIIGLSHWCGRKQPLFGSSCLLIERVKLFSCLWVDDFTLVLNFQERSVLFCRYFGRQSLLLNMNDPKRAKLNIVFSWRAQFFLHIFVRTKCFCHPYQN